jgi:hypothetical protein
MSEVPTITALASNSMAPTKKPTRVWTPVPSTTPQITQLPTEILSDIFSSNHIGSEIGQSKALVQNNGNKLSSFDTEITTACKHTGEYGIRLKYAIESEITDYDYGKWSIGVEGFPLIDITNYEALEFWVKGTDGGERFEIWIANEYDAEMGVESTNYVEVSSTEWRKIHIPFSDYENSFSKIWSVDFYFYAASGTGSICIDNIVFTP